MRLDVQGRGNENKVFKKLGVVNEVTNQWGGKGDETGLYPPLNKSARFHWPLFCFGSPCHAS